MFPLKCTVAQQSIVGALGDVISKGKAEMERPSPILIFVNGEICLNITNKENYVKKKGACVHFRNHLLLRLSGTSVGQHVLARCSSPHPLPSVNG